MSREVARLRVGQIDHALVAATFWQFLDEHARTGKS
jgi:hypothetical protein